MQKYLGALASNTKLLELAKENFEDYIFEIDTVTYQQNKKKSQK